MQVVNLPFYHHPSNFISTMAFYRISFCTVCMNRTLHLKETLIKNIEDNSAYPHLEFVLLNYGSKDEMHDWVTSEMTNYLESGRLKYYKADFPQVFKMSHARNMAFKLATGDILCGLDADNFTGPGFADHVNQLFAKDKNIFLAPPSTGRGRKWWDVQGRLCLWKKDFYRFRGFDEAIVDYGFEDQDLKYRMILAGRRKSIVRINKFLQAIQHTDDLRIAGGITSKMLVSVLLTKRPAREWEMLYLRTDHQFERFRITTHGITFNKDRQPHCNPARKLNLQLADHIHGYYTAHDAGIACHQEDGKAWELLSKQQQLVDSNRQVYYRLEAGPLQDQLLMARACYMGKMKLLDNLEHRPPINKKGFGQGEVMAHQRAKLIVLE